MRSGKAVVALCLIALCVITGWGYFKHSAGVTPSSHQLAKQQSNIALTKFTSPKPSVDIPRLQSQLTKVSSVRGSHVDRPIITGSTDKLVLSTAITYYFDYFYSVHSQFSKAELLALFTADVQQQYPENYQAELIRLFRQFIAFKQSFAQALDTMSEHDVSFIMSHPNNFQALKRGIQQQHFSDDEIDALFTQQQRQLEKVSAAKSKQLKYQQYKHDIKNTGSSTAYSGATGQRLESLRLQRATWQQRLNNYASQRNDIKHNESLDDVGKEQAIHYLLNSLFEPLEAKRVMALERGNML